MKTFQKLIGMLVLGLSVGVAAQGCAAPTSDEDSVASQDGPELQSEGIVHPNSCPIGPPGIPVPISKEGAYDTCYANCMATPPGPWGPTPGQCSSTCCTQITGCQECYLQ